MSCRRPIQAIVRNAQASEVFRSAFAKASGVESSSISTRDLDDLLLLKRARPSVLLPLYELGGSALGIAARLAPSQLLKSILVENVDEASRQQFNDSLRELIASPDIDAHETLKFHRDHRLVEDEQKQQVPAFMQTGVSILQQVTYQTLKMSKNA